MSFMVFPPEVNSGMMYTGPGSASLMTAATAWDGLQADLTSTATSIQSVIAGLTSSWQGPSSAALASAAAPYVTWLESTAAQAAQIGAQAKTAAGLFETAHAATVPPPVIAANRALLLALISTNFFGQNTPAIMATEAHYEEMWAQDGAAMDSYLAASQTNADAMQKPTPAPQVAKAAQAVNPAASDPTPTTSWDSLWGDVTSGNYSALGTDLSSLLTAAATGTGTGAGDAAQSAQLASLLSYAAIPIRFLFYPISMLMSMMMRMAQMGGMAGNAAGMAGAGGSTALMNSIGEFVDGKLQGAVGTLVGHFTSATHEISAKLGQAASLGSLKVPQGWSMAADGMAGMNRAAPVLPHTTVSAPVQTMSSGMPGGPFGNALMGALAGRGMGGVAAKAPKIIPRSPAGG